MKRIYCHPANLALMEERFKVDRQVEDAARYAGIANVPIGFVMGIIGIQIIADSHLPRWGRRWRFRDWKHVIWEKSDEDWCIPLGIGHWEEDTSSPVFYEIDDSFMQPFKPMSLLFC